VRYRLGFSIFAGIITMIDMTSAIFESFHLTDLGGNNITH